MQTAFGQGACPDFRAREGGDALTSAFEKKLAVHAGFGGQQVPNEERGDLLDKLLQHHLKEDIDHTDKLSHWQIKGHLESRHTACPALGIQLEGQAAAPCNGDAHPYPFSRVASAK